VYTREQVINAYQRLGNIKSVCIETGCAPYVAYKWLKISKLLTTQESTRYGTNGQKQGARAELEFKRLVPFAMPTNKMLENNYPAFDFDINGTTVDVKFCSLCNGSGRYGFRTAQNKYMRPDWYCAFLANPEVKELIPGEYRILVIPDAMVQTIKSVSLYSSSGQYWTHRRINRLSNPVQPNPPACLLSKVTGLLRWHLSPRLLPAR